jgi:mRNA interferase RelE/StbE
MKTLVLTSSAAKDFDALPVETRIAVDQAMTAYAISGEGDVKALSGQPGYRLRVGQYRVIFKEDKITVLAIYIGRRQTTTYRK